MSGPPPPKFSWARTQRLALQQCATKVSGQVFKSTGSSGTELRGILLHATSAKYVPKPNGERKGDKDKQNDLNDAGNVTAQIHLSSLNGIVVSPQDGKLVVDGSNVTLQLYAKHKCLLPPEEREGLRKYNYIPCKKRLWTVQQGGVFYVSLFVSSGFTEYEEELKRHLARNGEVLVSGILPQLYKKKAASENTPGDKTEAQNHEEMHEEEHKEESVVDASDDLANPKFYGISANAKTIKLLESGDEDRYCAMRVKIPPLPKGHIPKIQVTPPNDDEISKLVEEKYAGNGKKYGAAADQIWKSRMTPEELDFYKSTSFYDLGPLEDNNFCRSAFQVGSTERPGKKEGDRKQLKLQAMVLYTQRDPDDENASQTFYVSFSLKEAECFSLLQIADLEQWSKIVKFHLPSAEMLAWVDTSDCLSRSSIFEDYPTISFGMKLVPKILISGLAYYLVNYGFEITPQCVRQWIYLRTGRTVDDEDGGTVEMLDLPRHIIEFHHKLGPSKDVINIPESTDGWRLGPKGKHALDMRFFCLIPCELKEEQYPLYLSWGDRKAEIISSVLSGTPFGSVTQEELVQFTEQFGYEPGNNHISKEAVFYAIKKPIAKQCEEAAKNTDKTARKEYPKSSFVRRESGKIPSIPNGGILNDDLAPTDKDENLNHNQPTITPQPPIITPTITTTPITQKLEPQPSLSETNSEDHVMTSSQIEPPTQQLSQELSNTPTSNEPVQDMDTTPIDPPQSQPTPETEVPPTPKVQKSTKSQLQKTSATQRTDSGFPQKKPITGTKRPNPSESTPATKRVKPPQ